MFPLLTECVFERVRKREEEGEMAHLAYPDFLASYSALLRAPRRTAEKTAGNFH